MPRGKNGAPKISRRKDDVDWGGFIDVRLLAADKDHFKDWVTSFDMVMLDDLLAEGLKLSLSFDAETDTYLACLTSDHHAGPNLRCVLPARAGIWEQAIALVVFKHVEMLGGDWGRYRPASGRVAEI